MECGGGREEYLLITTPVNRMLMWLEERGSMEGEKGATSCWAVVLREEGARRE